ncbi:MAG: hypothetical protein PVJ51_11055, partial [Acidobacteriota bacterium]
MNGHPHLHLLITDGVFDRDGTFEHFTYFDTHLIEGLFRTRLSWAALISVVHVVVDKLWDPRDYAPRRRWLAVTSTEPGGTDAGSRAEANRQRQGRRR